MRETRASTILLPLVLAFGCLACGAADAQNSGADEAASVDGETHDAKTDRTVADGEKELGFFKSVLDPQPEPVVIPAGTLIALRLETTLSSHETPVGSAFTAMVTQELSVDGRVVVPAGSVVQGHVREARPAKKIGGRALLEVSFDTLDIRDGESVAIAARLAEVGRSEVARDAAIIGGSTIGGAILGDAIHEGEGGTVGAIVGGIAGTVGALKTKGKPVVLPAGTPLGISLDGPVTVLI